jgi:hypothetical protein
MWNKKFKKYSADDFYKTQQKFPPTYKSKSEKVRSNIYFKIQGFAYLYKILLKN